MAFSHCQMTARHGCQTAQTWWQRKRSWNWDVILHPLQLSVTIWNILTANSEYILFCSLFLEISKTHIYFISVGRRGIVFNI